MKTMGISTDPTLLGVNLQSTLEQSPSVSTFLPEEDASICPLLSANTPSPPHMAFSHPLTPSVDNDSNESINCGDAGVETRSSSSGSSSGIGIVVNETVTSTLLNKNAYQNLGKKVDVGFEENAQKPNDLFNHLNVVFDKDTPGFVSWNWPLIRKCTFFVFMSSLLAMCAIVIAMIVTLPRTCNPRIAWFRGGVLYEIFPASFQDSDNNGVGDIRGIINRINYFENLGIRGIRLNSIFPSTHYPDNYQDIITLKDITSELGKIEDIYHLSMALHNKSMSLILDLPIYPFLDRLDETNPINPVILNENLTATTTGKFPSSSSLLAVHNSNVITDAMKFWLSQGVDGFFIQGLEYFANDSNLLNNIHEWKYVLGNDRVLIVSHDFIENLHPEYHSKIIDKIDLIDVYLNITEGAREMYKKIDSILDSILKPNNDNGPWIQWSLGGVYRQRLSNNLSPNKTLSLTLLQLMLPGTPNIFYGDEISLQESHDPSNDHIETKHLHHLSTMVWNNTTKFSKVLPWLPTGESVSFQNAQEIAKMIKLRNKSPAIYQNSYTRDKEVVQNTKIKYSQNDIIVIERIYPRRNSFASISNFGNTIVSLDLTNMFYSGRTMIGNDKDSKIYFDKFNIKPDETTVVRLDK